MKRPYIGVIPIHPYGSLAYVYTDQEAFTKARGLDQEFVRSAGGITTHTDDCNEFHVLFIEFSINVLAHECFHIVANLLRHRGVVLSSKSEEAFAYSVGWLAQEVYNTICDHQEKVAKKQQQQEQNGSTKPKEGQPNPASSDAPSVPENAHPKPQAKGSTKEHHHE